MIAVRPSYGDFLARKWQQEEGVNKRPHCYISKSSFGKTYVGQKHAQAELSNTRMQLIANLNRQKARSVDLMQAQMLS